MLNRLTNFRFIASLLLIGGITQYRESPHAFGQEVVKQTHGAVELNKVNYMEWRDHIVPQEAELKWQQIPWLTTFKDGILAANKAEKPLLFWTMNGHPLGCT